MPSTQLAANGFLIRRFGAREIPPCRLAAGSALVRAQARLDDWPSNSGSPSNL